MTKLIPTLAAAHAALVTEANGDAALLSTARKIDATLVDLVKSRNEEEKARYVGILMNSGSLKALKLVPISARPSSTFYGGTRPDPSFILSQPASYVREALKRGFSIDISQRMEMFKQIAANPDAPDRKQKEDMILSPAADPSNCHPSSLAGLIIKEMLDMTSGAEAIAPFAARVLKSCFKQDKESINAQFAKIFSIYDPSAASEQLYRFLLTYALLGAAKPSKDEIEHEEMERLAKAVASSAGRADMKTATGGLEAWLAGAHRKPPAIIQEFERKRLSWRAPNSANRYSGGLLRSY